MLFVERFLRCDLSQDRSTRNSLEKVADLGSGTFTTLHLGWGTLENVISELVRFVCGATYGK